MMKNNWVQGGCWAKLGMLQDRSRMENGGLRPQFAASLKATRGVKVHNVLPIMGAVMRSVWLTAPCDARMITERVKRKDARFSQGHKTSYNTVLETLLVESKHVV